jgi:hypothetical protein
MRFQTQFLRSGNLLRPDILTIENGVLIIKKRNSSLITSSEQIIPVRKVAGIKIQSHLIGTDFKFFSYSSELIAEVRGLSRSDALSIKNYFRTLIEKRSE